MSTIASTRRPRGASGRTLGLRIGRSVIPVGMVVAILAASLGAVALAASMQAARAATIAGAITDVEIVQESTGVWSNLDVNVEWAVPDSATAGDTFAFTLPDELERTLNGFEVRAPDGQLVANATISGKVVTFTLTDYVDTYRNVSGTAWFQTTVDRAVVTENGPVSVTFVSGSVTFDDSFEVTGIGPGTTPVDRTRPYKAAWWEDTADQGRDTPAQAASFRLESAWGPADTVLFEDAVGAGHAIDCSTVAVRLATGFDALNGVTTSAPADPSTYAVTCTPGTLTVTAGPLADQQMFRVYYKTDITDQTVGTYTNEATITADGAGVDVSASVKRSSAGGGGSGDLQPAIDVEKHGTAAGPIDGDADEAPGLDVGGDPTSVTMTVTNSGDEALEDVAVADTTDEGIDLVELTCDFSALGGPATGTTWAGPLAAGASFDCTGTLPALAGGTAHADTAAVTGTGVTTGTTVTDDDPWHAHNPDWFDLALRKALAEGQSATVSPLDTVDFTIEVLNQGSIVATDIEVTDHLPPGTRLADPDWTEGDGTATTTLPGPLAPGASATVDLTLQLEWDADAGRLDNLAEISSALDGDGSPGTDVDSVPDLDATNDELVDDVIDSTPTGDPADEDDHDIASVTLAAPVFDLALRKTTDAEVVRVGDVVDFTIEVHNQGNVAATDIVVADTIPDELAFVADGNEGWELVDGMALTTIPGPLAAGASAEVTISLEVVANAERIANDAEIAAAAGPEGQTVADVDSVPDADPSNDELVDDVIDSTPTGDPADEDDHDIAPLRAPAFDLALRKVLAEGQPAIVWPGDPVTFAIEVHNQGQQTATDIVLTDELPEGLAFDPAASVNLAAGWALADGQVTTTVAGPLAPGESTTVELVATVDAEVGPGSLVNAAEISAATDETGAPAIDVDSTPDTDLGGDALVDDVIDSTPTGDPADEDDHDVAEVAVPTVDLALRKQLAAGQATEVAPGSTVDFAITVVNQGDIAVTDVAVADTVPSGLAFVAGANGGWSEEDGVVTTTVAGPLEPGEQVELPLTLQVSAGYGEQLVNHAEITGQSDPDGTPRPDVDSTPDGDPTNDELIDDEIDGTPETGDEDDHDIAEVVTSSRQIDDTTVEDPPNDQPATSSTGQGSSGPGISRGTLARTGAGLAGLGGLGLGLLGVGWLLAAHRRPARRRLG